MRTLLITIALLISALPAAAENPRVTASIWPLGQIAERIGGPAVSVKIIVPSGAEPHEFEPSAHDIKTAYDSNVFVLLGGSMDPWAARIVPDLIPRGVTVLNVLDALRHPGSEDPHVWLDPVIAEEIVALISDALVSVAPLHADAVKTRTRAYLDELARLDQEYRAGLAQCELHEVVVTHDAFAYLAKRYGFQTHAISGLSPQDEPSARDLVRLVRLMRKKNIKHVMLEPMSSPKLAQTLARESNALTLELHPLGSLSPDDLKAGRSYLSVMRDNLRQLQTAMRCI